MRKNSYLLLLLTILISTLWSCHDRPFPTMEPTKARWWLTTPDQTNLFTRQRGRLVFSDSTAQLPTIYINMDETLQTIDGFGYTLTGGSALHLHRMDSSARIALLRDLFGTEEEQIGVSYLRVSLGASDLDERPFSYNDLPAGQTDTALQHFSLAPDEEHLIPVLREILDIYPELQIMASPWSPPAWMKDNGDTRGGSLRPKYYPVYANYFVKYIQGMAERGITIDAVTVQNEPLHPGNNPSLLMPAEAQADFIKNHLGPAFAKANITTKIIIYDHNADRPDYPLTILNDPEAAKYVDGTAFHLYAGPIDTLSYVHDAYPDKHIYFTEQWIGAPADFAGDFRWHVRELIIGATRNWARTVLEWNLANDPNHQPHTDRGGCTRCLGAVTIDGNTVTRNPAYYIIAHAAKFVRPGSHRIASTVPPGLPNVSFTNPEGDQVLIVLNDSDTERTFAVHWYDETLTATLPAGAVATYVWCC